MQYRNNFHGDYYNHRIKNKNWIRDYVLRRQLNNVWEDN